ncbi:Foie gras liver health family 1-domain-containing protein [Auriculariales sp. MPI-PUGE-AT-0066]|nr:Foie gras liver health family 1-domain-containing protein [Auriculariales sp. MPI-PUGE-AT-0066]
MNSYPVELLAQPCPVMFVAGLEAPPAQVTSPTTASTPATGSSPPMPGPPLGHRIQTTPAHHDPFVVLQLRLRDALTQIPKNSIWLPDRGRQFQVHLVEKNVRFPPRKMFPPTPANRVEETLSATAIARSPLSPLMPSSPLHPDGLIAPIWMRKHLELVPSVFVLFLRLWELPAPTSPLEGHSAQDREEERRHDMELANEIASRKKAATERGIKLTCVLLASRRMLDDPNLDPRLTFIRRQSALDSRAALFVLSPVSAAELTEFVKSLQDALHESAMEYYSNHSKRVRKKRNRHANVGGTPPALAPNRALPLRPIGWSIRYDYKLAAFAEFRSEEEVARKHYEDCWSQLVDMFSSTGMLPPRTKRWAEAKVLADSISVKICKLYLYHGEHARALAHLNRHIQRFSELSRAWGIGEDTYEYWSWQARQQRVLAEMLEVGIRSGLRIPTHLPHEPINPVLQVQLATVQGHGARPSGDLSAVFGEASASALQHPGFYYFAAAHFTQRRYQQFVRALETEAVRPTALSATQGFLNEKKVDHHALILELHTKAYDLFKKYNPSSLRLTLYVAYHIGLAHHSSGKHDLAARFFERIAQTYRRESWGKLLHPILTTWYASVRQLPDGEPAVKLLFEMLAWGVDASKGSKTAQELSEFLKASVPDKDGPLALDTEDTRPLGNWRSIFWSPVVVVDAPAPFQLHLQTRSDVQFSALPVDALLLYFSGNETPSIVVRHVSSSEQGADYVGVGNFALESSDPVTVQANLHVPAQPKRLVLGGAISRATPGVLQLTKAVLCLCEGEWKLEMPLDFDSSDPASPHCQLLWLSGSGEHSKLIPVHRPKPNMTSVKFPPHQVTVSLEHKSPAYLDESYPIELKVVNNDQRSLDVTVDVLLQPMEHGAEDEISLDDQRSTTLLKAVALGQLEPGAAVQRTISLFCTRAPGDRVLDISVQSRAPSSQPQSQEAMSASRTEATDSADATAEDPNVSASASPQPPELDLNEDLHTLVVPTVAPLEYDWDVTYVRPKDGMQELAALVMYDAEAFESEVTAMVVLTTVAPGPWDVEVQSLVLDHETFGPHKVLRCSAEQDEFPLVLQAGDSYSTTVTVALTKYPPPLASAEEHGELKLTWRRVSASDEIVQPSSSTILLPPLHAPADEDIFAFVTPPTTACLHQIFPLRLVVQNRHPSRTADLSLQLEPNENFVIAGPRAVHLPLIIAGAQHEFNFNLMPLLCGQHVRLPTIRLFDNRTTRHVPSSDPYAGTSDAPGVSATTEIERAQIVVRDSRIDVRLENGTDAFDVSQSLTVLVLTGKS